MMKRSLILIYFVLLSLSVSNIALAAKAPRLPVKTPENRLAGIEEFLKSESDSGGPVATDDALSPAGQNLERDLLSAVSSFERPVRLYHYFQAPTDSNNTQKISPYFDDQEQRLNWVKYFIGFRTGAFWDPNNHVDDLINAGPGMYQAIDPNASRDFGESAIVMDVPAGLKYLSVVNVIALRKQTRDLLVKEGIVSKKQLLGGATTLGLTRGFSGDALKNMVREENAAFKKLVNQIFTRNRIMFIEYVYKSHLAGFCKVSSQSAFVFVGEAPDSTEPDTNGEVLGKIPSEITHEFMFSDLDFQNMTDDEIQQKDLLSRFRNVLQGIRDNGTGKAQQLMDQNLNDEEINELADMSYRCERRH